MAKYFGKRLVIGLITLFALATITFFLMHAIPGSPFAGETSKLPANVKEKLVEQYGLDKPVTEQYVRYLQNAVKGDFGTSLNRKGKAVSDIIMAGIPYTASLGLAAFCIVEEGRYAELYVFSVKNTAAGLIFSLFSCKL